MPRYEVVEATQQQGGWVVTFAYTVKPSWWRRLLGRSPYQGLVLAYTEGHTDWRYFPTLDEASWNDWLAFNDAWERHEILERVEQE